MKISVANGHYLVEIQGMLNGIPFYFAAVGESQREAMSLINKPYSDFVAYAGTF